MPSSCRRPKPTSVSIRSKIYDPLLNILTIPCCSSVVEAIEEVSRKEFPRHRRAAVLEVMTQDEEDEDVEIPFIKYNI